MDIILIMYNATFMQGIVMKTQYPEHKKCISEKNNIKDAMPVSFVQKVLLTYYLQLPFCNVNSFSIFYQTAKVVTNY